jgi:Ca-activated chloride channel family protein
MIATLFAVMFMLQLMPQPMKGNQAYRGEQYEDAVRIYREALEQDPQESKLLFNLGNALSMSGNKEESIEAFKSFKAAAAEGREGAKADYNIGTLLAEEDPETAIESFISALRQNPDDEDAKHNLESLLKQQQQQQEQQEQQQEQNQDPNQQDQQDSGQNQESDPSDGSPPPDQQSQQTGQQPKIQPREAEALLDALEQREKDLLRAMKKESEQTTPKKGKDW